MEKYNAEILSAPYEHAKIADAVLKAAGSGGLQHYMPYTKKAIFDAMAEVIRTEPLVPLSELLELLGKYGDKLNAKTTTNFIADGFKRKYGVSE